MLRTLNILLDDRAESHCYYPKAQGNLKQLETYKVCEAIEYAVDNQLSLNLISGVSELDPIIIKALQNIDYRLILPSKHTLVDNHKNTLLDVHEILVKPDHSVIHGILRCERDAIPYLPQKIETLLKSYKRVDVRLVDMGLFTETDINVYQGILLKISHVLLNLYREGKKPETNLITDVFSENKHDCGAGTEHVTLAPDGDFYICPGFYTNPELDIGSIGSLRDGIHIPDARLLEREYSPICRICEAGHCPRCVYMNRLYTDEINIPSEQQCVLSHLEHGAARELIDQLQAEGLVDKKSLIPPVEVLDPFTHIISHRERGKKKNPVIEENISTTQVTKGKYPINIKVLNDNVYDSVLTKNTLEYLYSEYIENLRKLPYAMKWLDIRQIRTTSDLKWNNLDESEYGSNTISSEAQNTEDELRSYWPLFVIEEDNGYLVKDEDYRVHAYKELATQGKWNHDILGVTDKLINPDTLAPITYTIPSPLMLSAEFMREQFIIYKTKDPSVRATNGEYIIPYQSEDGYDVAMLWTQLLQNLFFDYGEKTGDLIKPSAVINDMAAWETWRGH